jgi:predicted RNA-binding protein (virulence factor B family)
MVPFSEQNQRMEIDRWYVIRLLLDEKTNRLVASNKLNKFIETDFISVEVGEEVDLLVIERSDLGYTLIINNVHKGLAFANETFRELNVGETLTGYVKNIREDGKIDISLQKQGYQNVEPSAIQILELLKENGGFLALTDKSEPEAIYSQLEMSKKTFKKAIGGLYKSKLIRISEEGIYLL